MCKMLVIRCIEQVERRRGKYGHTVEHNLHGGLERLERQRANTTNSAATTASTNLQHLHKLAHHASNSIPLKSPPKCIIGFEEFIKICMRKGLIKLVKIEELGKLSQHPYHQWQIKLRKLGRKAHPYMNKILNSYLINFDKFNGKYFSLVFYKYFCDFLI